MDERHGDGIILGRWVVAADELHEFARVVRLRSKHSYVPPGLLKECKRLAVGTGAEVVFRERAFFVGGWRLPIGFSDVYVHDSWMEFTGDEGYLVPVPVARGAKTEARRIAEHYQAIFSQSRDQANREFAEERAKPTWNNRILNFVEAHFVWVLLGFFFVLIPLVVLVIGLFRGSLSK